MTTATASRVATPREVPSMPASVDARSKEPSDELLYADLPCAFEREQLMTMGWTFEPTPSGCVLRKAAEGYPAKLFSITAHRLEDARFLTYGEVTLHGTRCSATPSVVMAAPRLFERLLFLTEATELLSLFDDSVADFGDL